MPPWLGLDDALARALPALWERLVDEPSVVSGLMEDLTLPPGQRIQGWGVTMIVPETLVQAMDLDREPEAFVSRRIFAALRGGSLAPMSDREIGAANAQGTLTMVILHFSQRDHDISSPYVHSVIAMANDTFRTRGKMTASAARRSAGKCSRTCGSGPKSCERGRRADSSERLIRS